MNVPLSAISAVEAGIKKSLLTSTPAVTVTYQVGGKSKKTTWLVPPNMVEYGNPLLFTKDKIQTNSCSAEEFAGLLKSESEKLTSSS